MFLGSRAAFDTAPKAPALHDSTESGARLADQGDNRLQSAAPELHLDERATLLSQRHRAQVPGNDVRSRLQSAS